MNYADVRSHIRTGDLIAIRKRGGFLPTLTRWITKSPYTHTGLAVWVGDDHPRLLVAESKASGDFLTPLSQYAEIDFDVFTTPSQALAAIEEVIWQTLGQHVGYDFADLLVIGLNRLVGMPLPKADDSLKVCSGLVASMWLQAGWQPWFLPSIPAPDDVVAALGVPPRLMMRASDA